MSAISGIVQKNGAPCTHEQLNKMNAALSHRDKDGSAIAINGIAGLACCQLNRFRNNQGESLPYIEENLIITANAQLDNRAELQKKLGQNEISSGSLPDAYLVLAAFKKWGEECVHHLEGMYVFAIWNSESGEMFIAADHLGHKCLYYYESAECFIFSSEIKAIEAVKSTPNYIDEERLIKKLLKADSPVNTYNREIKRLSGGHCISIKKQTVSIKEYWTFKRLYKYNFTKDQDWYDQLHELVYEAILKRIDTDGNIGIKLSGGLDSAAIAGIVASALQKKNKALYAYSSVVDPKFKSFVEDESKFIEIVRQRYPNILLHAESASNLHPFSDVEKSFHVTEDYVHNILFMFIRIMEGAQKDNISVMFTGFGGDQWISTKGIGVIYHLLKSGSWKEAFRLINEVSAYHKRSLLKTLNAEVFSNLLPYKVIRYFKKPPLDITYNFVKKDIRRSMPPNFRGISPMMQSQYIQTGLASQALQHLDQLCGYHGMVAATPYQDKAVLEFLADVPLRLFLKDGYKRSLFRNTFRNEIPPEILWRFTKSNYIPDITYRLYDGVAEMQPVFSTDDAKYIIKNYLDKEAFEKAYHECFQQPVTGHSGKMVHLAKLGLGLQTYYILKKNKTYLHAF